MTIVLQFLSEGFWRCFNAATFCFILLPTFLIVELSSNCTDQIFFTLTMDVFKVNIMYPIVGND